MTDLERHLYNLSKGRFHSKLGVLATGTDEWEIQVTCPSASRLAIISMEVTCQTTRQAQGNNDGGIGCCLSTGTTHAAVDADSSKIVLFEEMEASVFVHPVFMDFSGCPVFGLEGQNIHLMAYSATSTDWPVVIINYMVLPI